MSTTTTEPVHRLNGERLHVEGVALDRIADDVGTPVYVYSAARIRERFGAIKEALSFAEHTIAYAVKANSNLGILRLLHGLGAGADIVSGGELNRCLRAEIPADHIVFSGVGKTDDELRLAINQGIRSIHVESADEVTRLEGLANALGKRAPVSFRVNPDVDPQTHPYIATGLHGTKFGLEVADARNVFDAVRHSPHVELEGLACHIGSQIRDPGALREAVCIVANLLKEFRAAGAPARTLDAGGGWPVNYGNESAPFPEASAFGDAIRSGLKDAELSTDDVHLMVEPGRTIVGDAGLLLTEVLFTKRSNTKDSEKRFVIVDAAMNDLIRPALYQAHHEIVPVRGDLPHDPTPADIVGPVCESGDFLGRDRQFPAAQRGDRMAVLGAGAYAMVMASNYNSRPRPPEVLVDGDSFDVIRKRETFEDLVRLE